jgi:hypothetical protein
LPVAVSGKAHNTEVNTDGIVNLFWKKRQNSPRSWNGC